MANNSSRCKEVDVNALLKEHLNLNDNKCPICMKIYTDPVYLPCTHTFCKMCVKSLADKGGSVRCSRCSKRFSFKSVVNTPPLFTRYIQIIQKFAQKEDQPEAITMATRGKKRPIGRECQQSPARETKRRRAKTPVDFDASASECLPIDETCDGETLVNTCLAEQTPRTKTSTKSKEMQLPYKNNAVMANGNTGNFQAMPNNMSNLSDSGIHMPDLKMGQGDISDVPGPSGCRPHKTGAGKGEQSPGWSRVKRANKVLGKHNQTLNALNVSGGELSKAELGSKPAKRPYRKKAAVLSEKSPPEKAKGQTDKATAENETVGTRKLHEEKLKDQKIARGKTETAKSVQEEVEAEKFAQEKAKAQMMNREKPETSKSEQGKRKVHENNNSKDHFLGKRPQRAKKYVPLADEQICGAEHFEISDCTVNVEKPPPVMPARKMNATGGEMNKSLTSHKQKLMSKKIQSTKDDSRNALRHVTDAITVIENGMDDEFSDDERVGVDKVQDLVDGTSGLKNPERLNHSDTVHEEMTDFAGFSSFDLSDNMPDGFEIHSLDRPLSNTTAPSNCVVTVAPPIEVNKPVKANRKMAAAPLVAARRTRATVTKKLPANTSRKTFSLEADTQELASITVQEDSFDKRITKIAEANRTAVEASANVTNPPIEPASTPTGNQQKLGNPPQPCNQSQSLNQHQPSNPPQSGNQSQPSNSPQLGNPPQRVDQHQAPAHAASDDELIEQFRRFLNGTHVSNADAAKNISRTELRNLRLFLIAYKGPFESATGEPLPGKRLFVELPANTIPQQVTVLEASAAAAGSDRSGGCPCSARASQASEPSTAGVDSRFDVDQSMAANKGSALKEDSPVLSVPASEMATPDSDEDLFVPVDRDMPLNLVQKRVPLVPAADLAGADSYVGDSMMANKGTQPSLVQKRVGMSQAVQLSKGCAGSKDQSAATSKGTPSPDFGREHVLPEAQRADSIDVHSDYYTPMESFSSIRNDVRRLESPVPPKRAAVTGSGALPPIAEASQNAAFETEREGQPLVRKVRRGRPKGQTANVAKPPLQKNSGTPANVKKSSELAKLPSNTQNSLEAEASDNDYIPDTYDLYAARTIHSKPLPGVNGSATGSYAVLVPCYKVSVVSVRSKEGGAAAAAGKPTGTENSPVEKSNSNAGVLKTLAKKDRNDVLAIHMARKLKDAKVLDENVRIDNRNALRAEQLRVEPRPALPSEPLTVFGNNVDSSSKGMENKKVLPKIFKKLLVGRQHTFVPKLTDPQRKDAPASGSVDSGSTKRFKRIRIPSNSSDSQSEFPLCISSDEELPNRMSDQEEPDSLVSLLDEHCRNIPSAALPGTAMEAAAKAATPVQVERQPRNSQETDGRNGTGRWGNHVPPTDNDVTHFEMDAEQCRFSQSFNNDDDYSEDLVDPTPTKSALVSKNVSRPLIRGAALPPPEESVYGDLLPPTVAALEDEVTVGAHSAHILGSNLSGEDSKMLSRMIKTVGARQDSRFSSATTHLVAMSSGDGCAPRTAKFICAMAGGAWIVSVEWARKCLEHGSLLLGAAYELKDDVYGDSPRRSRLAGGLLFRDFAFILMAPYSEEIDNETLTLILNLAGAVVVKDNEKTNKKYLVALAQQDNSIQQKESNEAFLAESGILMLGYTWAHTSVCAFALLPVWNHMPSDSHVPDSVRNRYPPEMFDPAPDSDVESELSD